MEKFKEEYAEKLADKLVVHGHESDFIYGYMKALEETGAKELLEALIEIKKLIAFNQDSELGLIVNNAIKKTNTMATTNQYIPQSVSHPGETLMEKLEELGMGPKEFAVRTQKPEKTISNILAGESSITSDMAVVFEDVLGIPARFWLARQQNYNEAVARLKKQQSILNDIAWAALFPYSDMVKLGWIKPQKEYYQRVKQILIDKK